MSVSARPGREGSVKDRGKDIGGGMRWEIFSEDGRPLLYSYMLSFALAIVFLLLVKFGPKTEPPTLLPKEEAPIVLNIDSLPTPTVYEPPAAQEGEVERVAEAGDVQKKAGPVGDNRPGDPKPGAPGSRTETKNNAGAIGDAFGTGSGSGTGGLVGDVSGIMSGVQTGGGSGGSGGGLGGVGGGGTGGKVVLGGGQGGQGSTTPGRGGIGGGTGTGGGEGGGIGGVGRGGGVTRGAVRVSAPAVVSAPSVGPRRDVGELGAFVRSRESQLRYCYVEQGLKVNPQLSGTINVAISLTESGSVTDVDVTRRTWSGAGASEAESCITNRIRSWRFPASEAGGTYSFPFNFTRGG